MSEFVYGVLIFAALMAVYALGWIAGHDHYKRWYTELRISDLPRRRIPITRLGPGDDE